MVVSDLQLGKETHQKWGANIPKREFVVELRVEMSWWFTGSSIWWMCWVFTNYEWFFMCWHCRHSTFAGSENPNSNTCFAWHECLSSSVTYPLSLHIMQIFTPPLSGPLFVALLMLLALFALQPWRPLQDRVFCVKHSTNTSQRTVMALLD